MSQIEREAFITTESGDAGYRVIIKCSSIKEMQVAHRAVMALQESGAPSDRAQPLVKGDAVAMGRLTFEPDEHYKNVVLVRFSSEDECRQAIQSGQCRFTVFGGEV